LTHDNHTGACAVWRWNDEEIENPGLLKNGLMALQNRGFSRVWARLGDTRYGLADRRVIRALAQASQWARRRDIIFWFQADPQRAARFLIQQTGERTQNLIALRDPGRPLSASNLCLQRVSRGGFRIRCAYRRPRRGADHPEKAIWFEPSGLERAFCLQIRNGCAVADSIRDITTEARFYVDAAAGKVEMFGRLATLENGGWWVLAFPRFDTNLADFAGRASNDALQRLVEDWFDAGASMNGVAWGEGGYLGEPGRFAVSESLYNSFLAEYGYDLRDRLTALVLPMDDGSHRPVRRDYHGLLDDAVRSAYRDFDKTLHGYFGGIQSGLVHGWSVGSTRDPGPDQEWMDPWRALVQSSIGLTAFVFSDPPKTIDPRSIVSRMVIAKSLGVCTPSRNALIRWPSGQTADRSVSAWVDLLGLYSVRWLLDAEDAPAWADAKHRNLAEVERITGFRFPEADTLLVFPQDAMTAQEPSEGRSFAERVHRCIGRLTLEGIQMDAFSPSLLRLGRWSPDGFRIGWRTYRAAVVPFPESLTAADADLFREMARRRFPLVFGGCSPSIDSAGEAIFPVSAPVVDLETVDLERLAGLGIRPLFEKPRNAAATLIRHPSDLLFLLCPVKPGVSFSGKVAFNGVSFEVPKTSSLAVFRVAEGKPAERVL
jgi:hypothetical protein